MLLSHGSPRDVEELVTPGTPAERMHELLEGVDEPVLATAHTHLQFDRRVAGVRSLNPGSVGMAYGAGPVACWALLGPDVELRRTAYDVAAASAAWRASGNPNADGLADILLDPPGEAEVIEHAEARRFSG